jgi:hypothetical protein
MTLTDTEIEEIKTRHRLATPGPWTSFIESRDQFSGSDFIRTPVDDLYVTGATAADLDFIAHARQDIPKLVEELVRLKKAMSDRSSYR